METLYRVQDVKGIGPYQNYDNYAMLCSHVGADHPSPNQSGSHAVADDEYCAFRTMQDLFRWFGGWLPGLIMTGYRVVKVTGTVTYADNYQVVFKPI